jgi:hypothetical protein
MQWRPFHSDASRVITLAGVDSVRTLTVTVLWTDTKAALIRKVTKREAAIEYVLINLRETNEAYPGRLGITIKPGNQARYEQWKYLVGWARVDFKGTGPVWNR